MSNLFNLVGEPVVPKRLSLLGISPHATNLLRIEVVLVGVSNTAFPHGLVEPHLVLTDEIVLYLATHPSRLV
jgi:hypothetical protein